MKQWRHGVKPVIGLIGGIGAGKSAAARCFEKRGGLRIDADRIGHEVLEEPGIVENIVGRWGVAVTNAMGTLDRKAIGTIIFANPTERRALEEMVFPAIGQRCLDMIAQAQANPAVAFVVLDAAVMLEAGWTDIADFLVYVDAPRPIRLARVAARNGWTEPELTAREAAQWDGEIKKRHATAIVSNAAGFEELQTQVDQLLSDWKLLSA